MGSRIQTIMRPIFLLGALLCAGSARAGDAGIPPARHAAQALPPLGDSLESVQARLAASEMLPAESEWNARTTVLGPIVLAIAKGNTGKATGAVPPALLRARAVSALAYFPTQQARALLEEILREHAQATTAANKLLLRKAAVAYGWQGAGAGMSRLIRLLEHNDPDVRIDAALALGLTRKPEAAERLRAREKIETDPRAKRELARQIRVIDNALLGTGHKRQDEAERSAVPTPHPRLEGPPKLRLRE